MLGGSCGVGHEARLSVGMTWELDYWYYCIPVSDGWLLTLSHTLVSLLRWLLPWQAGLPQRLSISSSSYYHDHAQRKISDKHKIVFIYQWLSPRHLEPSVVCGNHSYWIAELHGECCMGWVWWWVWWVGVVSGCGEWGWVRVWYKV